MDISLKLEEFHLQVFSLTLNNIMLMQMALLIMMRSLKQPLNTDLRFSLLDSQLIQEI